MNKLIKIGCNPTSGCNLEIDGDIFAEERGI